MPIRNTGDKMVPLILFISFMVIFGIVDLWFWLTGKETMSEQLVTWATKYKWFAWTLLAILFGAATYLAYHFELFDLLP